MKFLTLIFILNFYVTASAKSHFVCHNFLNDTATEHNGITFTENFLAYLKHLYKEGIVTTNGLVTLKQDLEKKSTLLTNPVMTDQTSAKDIHAEQVNAYLSDSRLQRQELLQKIAEFLETIRKQQNQQRDTSEKTIIAHRDMKMHRIEKGSFRTTTLVNHHMKEVEITLTHSFLMMETFVTQKMWAEVFKTNPSSHLDTTTAPFPQLVRIDDTDILMLPDHPVNFVSWWSALEFANELSRRHGLKPVYILDYRKMKQDTSAKDGTLAALTHKELVKINSPTGSIYDTEGYRLPTGAEAEFVRSNRGQVHANEYFPGVTKENIGEYAWGKDNTKPIERPQAVADRTAFIIDGNAFYDLYGNLYEFNYGTNISETLVDPEAMDTYKGFPNIVGRSFEDDLDRFRAGDLHASMDANAPSKIVGIRLVRSLPK